MSTEIDSAAEAAADAFYGALMGRFMKRIGLGVSIAGPLPNKVTLNFMLVDKENGDTLVSEIVTLSLDVRAESDGTLTFGLNARHGYY